MCHIIVDFDVMNRTWYEIGDIGKYSFCNGKNDKFHNKNMIFS